MTTSTLIELDSFINQPRNASDTFQLSAKLMVVHLILSHTPCLKQLHRSTKSVPSYYLCVLSYSEMHQIRDKEDSVTSTGV